MAGAPLDGSLTTMKEPKYRDLAESLDYNDPACWNFRSHQRYYRRTVKLAKRFAPWARSVLDVGSNHSRYIEKLDWIAHRERLDLLVLEPIEGVIDIRADFMEFEAERAYDLVLCLQVIEHLEDPAAFCQKLLASGRVVILSVPYQWPAEAKDDHLHDPVDEAKLWSWTGRKPLRQEIVKDLEGACSLRLLSLYAGDPCSLTQALRLRWKAR